MTNPLSRPFRFPIICALAVLLVAGPAAAQSATPPQTAAQAGKASTMAEGPKGKLDAYLKQAVDDKRAEVFSVMIRLAAGEGADARLQALLEKLELKVDRTLSDGKLFVVSLKVDQLLDVAASDDVARISFDAIVTPQRKET